MVVVLYCAKVTISQSSQSSSINYCCLAKKDFIWFVTNKHSFLRNMFEITAWGSLNNRNDFMKLLLSQYQSPLL